MGIFSFLFGKASAPEMDPASEIVCQSIADAIVDAAFKVGLNYRDLGINKAVDVSAEFCFVLLNFVDVSAFSVLGNEKRNATFDRVALLTINTFTNKFFNSTAPTANVAKYKKAMLSVANTRNQSYGLCRGSFKEISIGLSFYINKALGFTKRDNIDSIIADTSKYTERDFRDLPKIELIEDIGKELSEALAEVDVVRKLEQLA